MPIQLLLLLLLWLGLAGSSVSQPSISPLELERLRLAPDAPLILDVRSREEFAMGHIPGAINLPHDELPSRIGELGRFGQRTVVLYCRSGRRVGLIRSLVERQGFAVYDLRGSFNAWRAADLPQADPLASSPPSSPPP